jgi:hypothetical protein
MDEPRGGASITTSSTLMSRVVSCSNSADYPTDDTSKQVFVLDIGGDFENREDYQDLMMMCSTA